MFEPYKASFVHPEIHFNWQQQIVLFYFESSGEESTKSNCMPTVYFLKCHICLPMPKLQFSQGKVKV